MKLNRRRDFNSSLEKTLVAIITLGIVLGAQAADPPYNLPRVRAVPSDLGGEVICYGMECANMLDSIWVPPPLFPLEFEWIDPEPTAVDHEQFCRELAAMKPAGCSASNPPSTPLTNPSGWQPNGCGDGSFKSNFAEVLVVLTIPLANSLDNPSPDVNFRSACNAHDACYAVGDSKSVCDSNFLSNMQAACSSSSNPLCNTIADGYHTAVSELGSSAYNSSISDLKCAIWAAEMRDNGCN